ncbi:MAG: energy-coupling factor transporter transmembrane protein EcfT [Chloroflexales bacterium]|nr:energy-coupling factor transporter transmembrane protein EcfT [Chloroflexales bacterium]
MSFEISRAVTFGQYLNLGSPLHRLDPRTKLSSVAVLMTALMLCRTPGGLAVGLLAAALIQVVGRIPLGYTLRGLRLLITTMLFLFIFQALFYRASPEETLWSWWLLSFSWAGVRQGAVMVVRVVLLYHLTTTLMFTTTLMDLADGVEIMLKPLTRVGVPVNELVMTLVVALKFVPVLIGELEQLIKAQMARGAAFDQGSILARARTIGATLVPLFINALGRAEVMTAAMHARCYRGGQGRTKRRVLTLRLADGVALAVALSLSAGALWLSLGLNV